MRVAERGEDKIMTKGIEHVGIELRAAAPVKC
jgi:hypothetical protein